MAFPKYRAAGIIDGADWDAFVLAMVAHSLRHVLAGVDPIITPLDARAIALTAHGDIVFSGAGNLLTRLPAGAVGDVLQSGGAGADLSWVAPGLPGAHAATHIQAAADPIIGALDARAIALANQGEISYHAAGANTLAALAVGVAGQVLMTGGAAADPYWGGASGGLPIFIPAPNPDGNTGRHAGQRLTDDVDVVVGMDFVLPYNFDITTWGVDVIIIPEGNGDMRRSVATDFGLICAGEQKDANSDTIAAGEVAVTLDEIECIDITGALAGSTALDLVGLEFTREGSHGNDTVDADCYFVGVVIRPP